MAEKKTLQSTQAIQRFTDKESESGLIIEARYDGSHNPTVDVDMYAATEPAWIKLHQIDRNKASVGDPLPVEFFFTEGSEVYNLERASLWIARVLTEAHETDWYSGDYESRFFDGAGQMEVSVRPGYQGLGEKEDTRVIFDNWNSSIGLGISEVDRRTDGFSLSFAPEKSPLICDGFKWLSRFITKSRDFCDQAG